MSINTLPKFKHFSKKNILKNVDINTLSAYEFLCLVDAIARLDEARDILEKKYPNIKFHILDIRKVVRNYSSVHNLLKAIDFYVSGVKNNKTFKTRLLQTLLDCGFKGVGFYKNQNGINSFHADTRKSYAFWTGTKTKKGDSWTYDSLNII